MSTLGGRKHPDTDPAAATPTNTTTSTTNSKEETTPNLTSNSGIKKTESNLKSKLTTPAPTVTGNAFRPVSGVRQPFNFVTQEVRFYWFITSLNIILAPDIPKSKTQNWKLLSDIDILQ